MKDSALLLTLIDARARIEHRRCWTKYAGAILLDGTSVASRHEDAVAWCAYGAIICTRPQEEHRAPLEICNALGFDKWNDLFYANDAADHPTVLSWFDRGIAHIIKRMGQHSTASSKELAHAG